MRVGNECSALSSRKYSECTVSFELICCDETLGPNFQRVPDPDWFLTCYFLNKNINYSFVVSR
jgi:hypothetical protein